MELRNSGSIFWNDEDKKVTIFILKLEKDAPCLCQKNKKSSLAQSKRWMTSLGQHSRICRFLKSTWYMVLLLWYCCCGTAMKGDTAMKGGRSSHPDVITTLGLIKLLLSYFWASRKWINTKDVLRRQTCQETLWLSSPINSHLTPLYSSLLIGSAVYAGHSIQDPRWTQKAI